MNAFNFIVDHATTFLYFLNMFENPKEKLLNAGLDLFTKQGFQNTTMRQIAKTAKMSLGASYYYFESKEAFVLEHYRELHRRHVEALGGFLDRETSFEKRLREVLHSKIQTAIPTKDMSRALYKTAADIRSELSPFSEMTRDIRDESRALFRTLVLGSRDKFHPEIKELLPDYLWLLQMGMILFWLHDESEDSKKTHELVESAVSFVVILNQKIQSPLALPIRKQLIQVLKKFAPRWDANAKTKEKL